MNTNKYIAWTLRGGIIAGIVLIIIGELLEAGNPILWLGVLLLILSPLFGVVVAFSGLIVEKDWFWAGIAGIVLIVVTAGLALAVV